MLIQTGHIMIFDFLHPLICIGGINACVIFCILIVTITLVYCSLLIKREILNGPFRFQGMSALLQTSNCLEKDMILFKKMI